MKEKGYIANMEDKEVWKDIPWYEGYYQVSNLGRVKRLERNDIIHNYGGFKKVGERILKAYSDKGVYAFTTVRLCKNGKTKKFILPRLVATCFINNPESKPMVLHKDDDPTNNIVSNLFWGTAKENFDDAVSKGRMKFIDNLNGCSNIKKRVSRLGMGDDRRSDLPVGVFKSRKRFRSRIVINMKAVNLGSYSTPEEASSAYQKKLKEIYE